MPSGKREMRPVNIRPVIETWKSKIHQNFPIIGWGRKLAHPTLNTAKIKNHKMLGSIISIFVAKPTALRKVKIQNNLTGYLPYKKTQRCLSFCRKLVN